MAKATKAKVKAKGKAEARAQEGEGTVLEALVEALERAAQYNPNDQVAPAAVLWPDKARQWGPLIPRLRKELPHLLTLGPYNLKEKTGPAIWIKCMLARALPEADWPQETVPVLYLPGVSRHELRAVEDCPQELQPLCELQYRGVWFTQENTKDWTVYAFLTSKRGGLGLDIAATNGTREALLNALTKLADVPLRELRGRRLHAEDFRELLHPDVVKQLLRWLNAPKETREGWSEEEWQAFCSACRDRYGFDPERDGELVGAEKLGRREGAWERVWQRFAEAPAAYPQIPELLRRAKPDESEVKEPLFFHKESWPQINERAEEELREELLKLEGLPPEEAAAKLGELEKKHGERRAWVWARLGQAPLAQALEPLALLAQTVRQPLSVVGETAEAMAKAYIAEGWRADAAALEALARVRKPQDVKAVKAALRAVYRPWLEEAAERFQERVQELPSRRPREGASVGDVEPGTCIVFADGLRVDLGKRLRQQLEAEGFPVEEDWRWVPLPPVTPTAKPAASPVADLLTGEGSEGEEFRPRIRETGKPLTSEKFRKLLTERGFQVLGPEETGDPEVRAWTEYGSIDRRGHDEGWKLARRIDEELNGLAERIRALLEAGWREVRVLTDHGWLLLPGGLPKAEMPRYLVETRWTRCAALKPGVQAELLTVPWHWDPGVTVAVAPGIGSFRANAEYSHGGLSLQECVVLDLVVRPAPPTGGAASGAIMGVRWLGLRCRVRVTGAGIGPDWKLDLRTRAADPQSSLVKDKKPKPVNPQGETSLVVEDPDWEGTAAILVLLAPDGRVAAKQNTTVGGEA